MQNLSTASMLTTQRLVLRGPQRDDLPGFTRFMTSAPSLEAQEETVIAEQADTRSGTISRVGLPFSKAHHLASTEDVVKPVAYNVRVHGGVCG